MATTELNEDTTLTVSTSAYGQSGGSTSSGYSTSTLLTIYIQIVIGSVGFAGNVFVIVVIVRMTKLYKQLANVFVVSQSVADATSSILLICLKITDLNPTTLLAGQLGSEIYCRMWLTAIFQWVSLEASTYNIVALTIERYMKIVHPVMHKTHFTMFKAKITLAFAWLVPLVFNFVTVPMFSGIKYGFCIINGLFPNRSAVLTFGILTITLTYWLPIIVFVTAYTAMIKKLVQHSDHKALSSTQRAHRNLTKTVILVCVGFVICWSASQWWFFLYNLGYPLVFGDPLYNFTVIMVSLHCCINPFIYIANYDQFRAAVRKIFHNNRVGAEPTMSLTQAQTQPMSHQQQSHSAAIRVNHPSAPSD